MTPKTDIKTTGGAGYIPPIPMNLNPYAGSLKDIAYRIMSQSSHQSRTLRDVMEATLQSIASSPYPEDRYTGSFAWYTKDPYKDLNRDLNHLVAFGNTKRQFLPTKITGFDYSDFLKKNYGVTTMPTYKGLIINTSKINIPTEYKPLVEFLADRPNIGYYTGDFLANKNTPNDEIDDGTTPFDAIDDTASYRRSFRRDQNGNAQLAAQDLIDYKGDYGDKYGFISGVQGKLLTSAINSPVLLDLGVPVNYTDNPADYMYGDGWYYTLQNLVNKNNILQKDKNDYVYPLVLPEIIIKPKKKTYSITNEYRSLKPKQKSSNDVH